MTPWGRSLEWEDLLSALLLLLLRLRLQFLLRFLLWLRLRLRLRLRQRLLRGKRRLRSRMLCKVCCRDDVRISHRSSSPSFDCLIRLMAVTRVSTADHSWPLEASWTALAMADDATFLFIAITSSNSLSSCSR